jgi:hypothetical protein
MNYGKTVKGKHFTFRRGNFKIGDDTLIMNITSATDCPSKALGLCKHSDKCYAHKAEVFHPTVRPFRRNQTILFDNCTAENFAKDTLAILARSRKPIKYLRFSEAGDFRSQADVDKLSQIASLLAGKIKVYGYTARRDLDYSNLSDNITINGSGFMLHNLFEAQANPIPTGKQKLCKGNCRLCKLCVKRSYNHVLIKYH